MFDKKTLSDDIFASFVVFLVSTPLCLGIAIAAGVDPVKGLLTAVIGGIIVGSISGAPLQISGPSAGLTVMVLHVVDVYGPQSLIPLAMFVGLFQISTGVLKVAHFFQATPPALLKAMLSGVGALILMSQFYVLFDLKMSSHGLENLAGIPPLFVDLVSGNMSQVQIHSGIIGALTVVILAAWNLGRGRVFDLVPGPLVSTLFASLVVYVLGWEMKMIHLPADVIGDSLNVDFGQAFSAVNFSFLGYAMGFAFIASAETLLCVSAVDKMAKTRSNYNQTIIAQGVGNIFAGLLGAIPNVGVIVRSAANLEFGAKTRLSSILHGVWVGIFLLIPGVFDIVPVPALAGLLIYTGFRLLDISKCVAYIRSRNKTTVIFLTTFILTVAVDLLYGVVAGFMMALLLLVIDVLKYDLKIEEDGDNKMIKFKGRLSFLDLPVLSRQLEGGDLENATNLEICLQEVEYLDPAISEHISELKEKLEAQGKTINIRYSKMKVH